MKKFSKELHLEDDKDGDISLWSLRKKRRLRWFCIKPFCRLFKIPLALVKNRKHHVRITIEFLKEL